MKKLLGSIIIGISAIGVTSNAQASGGVFGSVGFHDYPWSIVVGFKDYGHGYDRPRYVEHHHYYHKPRKHHYGKHHYKHHNGHHGYKHYRKHKRHYGHHDYKHYRKHKRHYGHHEYKPLRAS